LSDDNSNHHHTHFTGFMLEEEIGAALWGSTSKMNVDTKHFRPFCLMSTRNFHENSFTSNSIMNRNFQNIFYWWIRIIVAHSSIKIRVSVSNL
jgi:hypothetical protein